MQHPCLLVQSYILATLSAPLPPANSLCSAAQPQFHLSPLAPHRPLNAQRPPPTAPPDPLPCPLILGLGHTVYAHAISYQSRSQTANLPPLGLAWFGLGWSLQPQPPPRPSRTRVEYCVRHRLQVGVAEGQRKHVAVYRLGLGLAPDALVVAGLREQEQQGPGRHRRRGAAAVAARNGR